MEKVPEVFLKPFFVHSRKLFSEFLYKCFVIALHGIIGFLQIIIQNYDVQFALVLHVLHRCYMFCTGVTLFALVLHLNCIALSQSESRKFFMCIIKES